MPVQVEPRPLAPEFERARQGAVGRDGCEQPRDKEKRYCKRPRLAILGL